MTAVAQPDCSPVPTHVTAVAVIVATRFTDGLDDHMDIASVRHLLQDRTWLLHRLAETCPDHAACAHCGATLCSTCQIGEPGQCDHSLDSLCIGCDLEACRACADNADAERVLALATDGRLP